MYEIDSVATVRSPLYSHMSAHQSRIQRTSTLSSVCKPRVNVLSIQQHESLIPRAHRLQSHTENIEEALFDMQYPYDNGCTVQSDFLRINTNIPLVGLALIIWASAENEL